MKKLKNVMQRTINSTLLHKKGKAVILIFVVLLTFTNCFEDLDDNTIATVDINDFVWKGMNAVYLYKSVATDLNNEANNNARFSTNEDYLSYLNSFETPEDLFESLLYMPNTIDKFSRITSNYFDLQNQQQGTTITNGIEFNLYRLSEESAEVFGAITLVLNNSIADNLGLQRGQIFRAVNGQTLSTQNVGSLLSTDSYTLNFADYDNNGTLMTEDDIITLNGESTTLTNAPYTENPIHRAQIIELGDDKVGYLMYNGFNSNFDNALNDVFANFQAEGITELVVDLRYNGGGSVQTAAYLGSMITGQFTGQVFSKLFYNENLQNRNRDFLFTNTLEGGTPINHFNLSKVYVLTTKLRTASASELLINSLRPYIDVVVIGENTIGKTQASITIYDSVDLSLDNVNPNHTYAMQPLVANSANVDDLLVPTDGLEPTFELTETPSTLRTLGNIDEPLLEVVLFDIIMSRGINFEPHETLPLFGGNYISPFEQDMYID
ncbi:S41 family peptidase [Winogradskyella sp.]|nr:S41 family peptidase [Winogradskyella sp.]MDB9782645.1 S41 family peptidase [Winogradskyella sp.]MDC0007178.1 S41 family peptidase [Winogradskyella sp.]MDC1505535.1 S41 family peptidase [Winogradskyella sp.]